MEEAADKTYVSKRILEQYAQERQQRLEQKSKAKTSQLALAAGKTFSEDQDQNQAVGQAQADPQQQLPQMQKHALSLIKENPLEEEEKKLEQVIEKNQSSAAANNNQSQDNVVEDVVMLQDNANNIQSQSVSLNMMSASSNVANASAGAQAPNQSSNNGGGVLSSLQKLFSFGGSKKAQAKPKVGSMVASVDNMELSHDQYIERNNSCDSMDEDDLEGELNLSDDGMDHREEMRQRKGFMRAAQPQKKARKFRQEFDTNVTQVNLKCLENKGELATGDAERCTRCKGVFNQFSQIKTEGDNQIWTCEFCHKENEVMIEDEEIPQSNEVTYLLEASAQVQDRNMAGQDISVVFCLDISGSMCVTQAIQGKHNLKGDYLRQLNNDMRQFGDGSDQFVNAADRNKTYVSRIQCVKSAIDSQVNDMANGAENRKVGIVTFNHEVNIIGDGTQDSQLITGDKLNDFDYLRDNGKAQCGLRLTKPIGETKDLLKAKLNQIEETGPTALGPAILTSVSIATQGAAGSCVVICTDGLANIGLGAFDDIVTEQEQQEADSFYTKVGEIAQQAGITINIVSIEGDECNIDSLSKLADLTGGQVERVNPTTLTQNFANMLAKPVIATKVEAQVKLHQALQFRNELAENLSADKSLLTRMFGNVTVESIFTFEYGLKPLDDLLAMEEIDLTKVKSFPFQTQIEYTALDGSKCLRVITKKQEMSTERDQLERNADYNMLSYNAMNKASNIARGGDLLQCQAIMKNVKRKMHQNIQSEAQAEQYQQYSAQCSDVYRGLNSAIVQRENMSMPQQPPSRGLLGAAPRQPQQQYQQQQQLGQYDLFDVSHAPMQQDERRGLTMNYAAQAQPQQEMLMQSANFGGMGMASAQSAQPQQAQYRMNDQLSTQLAQMSNHSMSNNFRDPTLFSNKKKK